MQLKEIKPDRVINTVARQASLPAQASGEAHTHERGMPATMLRLQQTHGNRFVQRLLGGAAIQRKCSCGNTCADCREDQRAVQRQSDGSAAPPSVPVIVHDAARTPGSPLDPATRTFMEGRFGQKLGHVRVHHDTQSGDAARALGAYAYTVGHDIYFAPGLYNANTTDGKRLLAHELAHTIQQQGATFGVQRDEVIDHPGSPLEREADLAAEAVLAGTMPRIAASVPNLTPQMNGAPGDRQMLPRTVPGGRIEVVRTLEDRPCRRELQTESTQAGDLLFLDQEAGAFGIRYRYCRGGGRLEAETAGRYGQLRDRALEMFRNLGSTTSSGGLLTQIADAARQSRLGADTSVGVTVSGILRAETSASTQQGVPGSTREYQVDGLLRLTPRGWSLEISGQYRHVSDELRNTAVTSIQFSPTLEVGRVQAAVAVEHTEQQTAGGTPSATTTVRGSVSVRTGDATGVTFSGSTENGGSFFVSFGTVQRIPEVETFDCAICRCPPPLPHYACTRVTDAHQGPPVQTAGREVVELHYRYDSTAAEDQADYDQQVGRVVTLMGQNYAAETIRGYASPESNVNYNRDLAQRRANQARDDITAAMGRSATPITQTLPGVEGVGELLGAGAGPIGEARDRDLIRTLSDRLAALSEDEQFDLLGRDPQGMTTADRENLRHAIEAFRSGRENGRSLTQRARWERIFPNLRRVDVVLNRREIPGLQVRVERASTNCDADTLRWARTNFPPLGDEEVRPTLLGMC